MSLHQPVQDLVDQSLDFFGPIAAKAESVCAGRKILSLRDMQKLARDCGCRLTYSPALPPKHPGFAIVLDEEQCIALRKGLSPNAEMYTIAHELGHHVLGHTTSVILPPERREFEANLFAVLVLMRAAPQGVSEVLGENQDGCLTANCFAIGGGLITVAALGSWLLKRLKRPHLPETQPTVGGLENGISVRSA